MDFQELLVVSIAAFAVTYLLKYTYGPFNLFELVRQGVYRGFPKFFVDMYECFWCLGFWMTCIMFLVYIALPGITYVLCAFGVLGIIHEAIAE